MPLSDPWITRACLLGLPGVVDARIWLKEDRLIGSVTLLSTAHWTGRDLQQVCADRLGPQGAPQLLMISLVEPSLTSASA